MAITPDDIRGMEDKALEYIMPLWDNLAEGESEWFSYSITVPWSDSPVAGSDTGITATSTRSSGKIRFFKRPNGELGLETESNPIATSTNLSREGLIEVVKGELWIAQARYHYEKK